MIKYIKYIKITLFVIVAIAAIIFAKLYFDKCKAYKNQSIELEVKTQATTILTDKAGHLYARVLSYDKKVKSIKQSHDSIEIKLMQQAKLNKLKDYQISQLQYALIESKDSISGIIYDTITLMQGIKYDKFGTFNNGYLSANIYIVSDSTVAELTYKYATELYMIESYTKSKFFLWRWFGFKGKNQQFDFKCSDPNADIKVVRSINVNK